MSKSFPAFRPLSHGQWLSPPSFRPRSHVLPNAHICWMNQWCGGGCQIEWGFPLPCSLPMASLPPQSSRARRVAFWSEEECCRGFCCQGCQRLVFPIESNLPPTLHSVNLETYGELYICPFKISRYSWKRATSFSKGAAHLPCIFIVIR